MPPFDPAKPIPIEDQKTQRIVVPSTLDAPHPIIRRTAAAHGWALEPPWEGAKPDQRDCFDIRVGPVRRERALLLIDTLLKASNALGFEMRHDPNGSHHSISIFVDGEPIPLRLVEVGSFVVHLSLEIGRAPGRKTWKDNSRGRLEDRLDEVVGYLRRHAAARIARRRQEEECKRAFAELNRKRDELREDVRREQEAFDELIDEAESWRKAKAIRAYAAAVRAWAKRHGTLEDHAEWIDWAHQQAERLDPLCSSLSSVLDIPRHQWRELGDHEILNEDGSIEKIWG